MADLKVK